MVDMLWPKARFVCFLFVLVGGLISSLQISLLRESFELTSPGNLSLEGDLYLSEKKIVHRVSPGKKNPAQAVSEKKIRAAENSPPLPSLF